MFACSSLPMFSCMTVTTLSWPGTTAPSGKGNRALTWSALLVTVLMNLSLIHTDDAKTAGGVAVTVST